MVTYCCFLGKQAGANGLTLERIAGSLRDVLGEERVKMNGRTVEVDYDGREGDLYKLLGRPQQQVNILLRSIYHDYFRKAA